MVVAYVLKRISYKAPRAGFNILKVMPLNLNLPVSWDPVLSVRTVPMGLASSIKLLSGLIFWTVKLIGHGRFGRHPFYRGLRCAGSRGT